MQTPSRLVLATILVVTLLAGRAHAETVSVSPRDLLRHVIVVRDFALPQERQVRRAYGHVVRLGPLVTALGAIHSARAAARLDATLLAETRALVRGPYHISAQKLAQAEAAANRSRASLDSAEAALHARYGSRFAAALLDDRRLVSRIGSGSVSIVEATVPYPPLVRPPPTATANVAGGPNVAGRLIALKFLGVGGRVPADMVGQSLYYLGPTLQAGAIMRVSLPLAKSPIRVLKLPASALVFDGAKAIAFRRIATNRFKSLPLSHVRPFYTAGRLAGYLSVLDSGTHVPVVVKGVGLLWSLASSSGRER